MEVEGLSGCQDKFSQVKIFEYLYLPSANMSMNGHLFAYLSNGMSNGQPDCGVAGDIVELRKNLCATA